MTGPDNRIRVDVRGTEIESACHVLSVAYKGVDLEADVGDTDFSFRYAAAGDASMTVRALQFEGRLQGVMPAGDDYVVTWLGRGTGVLDGGHHPITTRPNRPQMWPKGGFEFEFERWDQRMVQVNERAVDEILAERGDDLASARFDCSIEPSDEALQQWRNTVGLISKTVLDRNASPILQAEMGRIAAIALIELYPLKTLDLPRELLLPRNVHIRAAVEYAHENVHLPITTTDLARVANISLRALQQAFVRILDTSPNTYLRQLRLERVHTELQEADPHTTNVSAVAARWGFAHAGRFAAAYQQRFGCYPKDTLRRS